MLSLAVSKSELAEKVQKAAGKLGLDAVIRNLENPRDEAEEHYYNPDHQHLLDLGYEPTHDMDGELEIVLEDLIKYKSRIEARRESLMPDVRWDGSREPMPYVK